MNASEMREFDEAELARRVADFQQELFNLRFQYATRQLTNHARFRVVRRDIARIRTLQRERELGLGVESA
ncbi:MAG: 50S ribosomal protein L29 [Chloroflexi bacterium]|nr:50S ribosomal protein L29 [Chloroflexota bacterium]